MPYGEGPALIPSPWDDRAAPAGEAARLLRRSNLLGADKRVTNFGGGNTSARATEADRLTGGPVEVLWVRGSGGDLGTMSLDSFATLRVDRLRALKARYSEPEHEDEVAALLPHATFGQSPRAAPIDTPLHAFAPRAHADHVHPDAAIALATSDGAPKIWGTSDGQGRYIEPPITVGHEFVR